MKRSKLAKAISVEQLCQGARDRLIEIERDDTERLWELRIPTNDGWRAWGSVEGDQIFNLLWWDPEHTVCRGLPKGISRQR